MHTVALLRHKTNIIVINATDLESIPGKARQTHTDKYRRSPHELARKGRFVDTESRARVAKVQSGVGKKGGIV